MKTILDYADLVKEQHALNTTIAPVETDLTSASKAYAVGQKFVYDGVLYQAKTAIAQGAALVLNTNYEAADDVSSEIEALTNKLADEVSARAELGAHNWLILDVFRGKESDTSYTSLSTGIEIANTTSGTYRVCSWWLKNLKPNTDYILSSDVTKVSGTGRMFVRDSDSGTILCDTQNISASKNVSLSFNTGTSTNIYIALYSSTATAEIGDIKYENLLLRLASDPDDTYQPYAKTNQELTAENQTLTNNIDILIENGAVNKLPNNATTQTITGIQITVNADKSMTISGSGNSATVDIFNDANNPIIISEDCKFSCGATFTSSTCEIVATATDNTTYSLKLSTGNSITIPAGKEIKKVTWYNNASYNETLTIYPMIADADYSGGYVPYAMTNRELTELAIVGDLSSQVTLTENCFSCSLLRQSNTCHVNVAVKSGINGFTSVATIPTDLKPKYNTPMACFAVAGADSSKIADAVLNTNGLISIRTTSATSDIAYLACTWIV